MKFLENNIKEYLLNRFNDLYSIKEIDKLRESYYRIINKINVQLICPICSNKIFYIKKTTKRTITKILNIEYLNYENN